MLDIRCPSNQNPFPAQTFRIKKRLRPLEGEACPLIVIRYLQIAEERPGKTVRPDNGSLTIE